MTNADQYETDPFRVLRGALSELCENALYVECETGDHIPCPDYVAELISASRAICDARTIADLANVPWISRKAVLGIDAIG